MANANKNNIRRSNRGRQTTRRNKSQADYAKDKRPGRRPDYSDVELKGENGAINDASYYVDESSTVLTDQLYTYSFTDFMGVTTHLGDIAGISNIHYDVPGIMQILVNPSIPCSDQNSPSSDGINVNGLKTFTILASESGRINNYQACDPNLAILAIGNVLSNFSWGTRAFGLVGTYNQRNRMFPLWSLAACGFDLQELKSNLANYRARFNYIIQKFNKIPIFRNIKYFEKCSKMFGSIYLDMSNSSMAQAYAFTPETFWILDEQSNPNGTILATVDPTAYVGINGFKMWTTFDAFLNMLESQIDALLGSTTLNLVYADIMRVAMKQGYDLLKLDEVPSNYVLFPEISEELFEWLNNAIIMGMPDDGTLLPLLPTTTRWTHYNDVESDPNTGTLFYNPVWANLTDVSKFKPLLNFRSENPTTDQKIYATRLLHMVDDVELFTTSSTPPVTYYIPKAVTLTDWYITRIKISNGAKDPLVAGMPEVFTIDKSYTSVGAASKVQLATIPDRFSKFDWHPLIYLVDVSSLSGQEDLWIVGDLQWYTTLDYYKLRSMDDVAMLNLMKLR